MFFLFIFVQDIAKGHSLILCILCVRKHTLQEALKEEQRGDSFSADHVHGYCWGLSKCISVIASSYPPLLLSLKEFRM